MNTGPTLQEDYEARVQAMGEAFKVAAKKVEKQPKEETNYEMHLRIKAHKEKMVVKKARAVVRKEVKGKRQHKIQSFFKKVAK